MSWTGFSIDSGSHLSLFYYAARNTCPCPQTSCYDFRMIKRCLIPRRAGSRKSYAAVLLTLLLTVSFLSCTDSTGNVGGTVQPFYGQPYVQTLLVFGLSKPDGGTVSEEEWINFVDTYVTPEFKEGLTILDSDGQWMMESGEVIKEDSKILILLYDNDSSAQVDDTIERIKETYKKLFNQEAVLRITTAAGVSF